MIYTFVLSLASIVFLVPFSLGISGYFFAYIVSNGISIFFILFFGGVWKSFTSGRFENQLMIQLLKYSAPMILNGIAWWITNASDRFMLQWFMDDRAVGLYGVVAKLPLLIGTFTGVFN
ncbi:oligosaccharide flippase family protein, partial [Streptococcus pneumoniae]|nr:oligosaccharide flippase family protein [Streptococcus pneumoniae]